MSEYALEEPPSQFRIIVTLLGVALLSAFTTPMLDWLRTVMPKQFQTDAWSANTDIWMNAVFLLGALTLCLITFKSSGLGFGEIRKWKRHSYQIAFAWIMPPLLVLSLYPVLTDTPYHVNRWPLAWWLVGSVAQEFLFTGFIYGRLRSIFGPPGESTTGAFSGPVLVTAVLYSLYHWPNLQIAGTKNDHGLSLSFTQFKFVYAFLGCAWLLNVRRWTDSVWPGVANHILVNFLATVM